MKMKGKTFYLLGLLCAVLLGTAAIIYFSVSAPKPAAQQSSIAEKYNTSGLRKYETGNYSGAIKEYSKAIQINEKDRESYFGRANSYIQIYMYKKALGDYDKAIELDTRNPAYYANRANAHYGLQNYQATLEDYNRAIRLNPNDGKLYQRRALIKEKNFKATPKELAADWAKAIKLGVKDEHIFISYGSYLNNDLLDYEGAHNCFQNALSINPQNLLAQKNLEIAVENIKTKKANSANL